MTNAWMAPHAVSILVEPPVLEPLTRAQAMLRAGLDWAAGDPREEMLDGWIRAARAKVELDTGLALLTQTRDVYFDAMPGAVISLPSQSRPLQAVTSISYVGATGTVIVVDPAQYVVDLASGRVGLALGSAWATDLRPLQPWVMRMVVGWPSAAQMPPLLLHAVGLLTAHYATFGRDLVQSGHSVALTPQGYDEAIASYQVVSLI